MKDTMNNKENGRKVSATVDISELEPPTIGLRWILVILGSFIYFIGFMLRNSLSVAIVAMVNTTKDPGDDYNGTKFACQVANDSDEDTASYSDQAEFSWDSSMQGLILGGYLWGYFIGRIVGGRIGEMFGQRETVLITMAIGGVMDLLTPVAAGISPYALLAVRFLMGLFHGPMFPSLSSLVSKWVLRSQLASTITIIYAGAPLGSMAGMLVASWIIEGLGWRWVFYIQGLVPFIWIPFWWYFVRNDPEKHPLITPYEKALLQENKRVTTKKSIPWKEVFTCPYIYVVIFCQLARSWMDVTQSTGGPTFFNKQMGIELSKASLVCAATGLLALPAMLIFGQTSDYIIRNNYVPKLLGRRIFHSLGTLGPAVIYMAIILSGCNVTAVIAFWLTLGIFMAATTVSMSLSVIDFAPNYAGTVTGLMGIGNGFASFGPLVISALVKHENGWDHVFYITIFFSVVSFILYSLVMTDQPQSWNYGPEEQKEDCLADRIESDKEAIVNESYLTDNEEEETKTS